MFETVINNGQIIDPLEGSLTGNIGINGGKIEEISRGLLKGKKEIDAQRKVVCPGFIDIHMHEGNIKGNKIDNEIFNYMALMGVTTVVGGNCGLGEANISNYLQILDKQGIPVNYVGLIGHAGVREKVGLTNKYKSSSGKELKKISEIIQNGLEKGAAGISFGLEYIPGTSIEEILELCNIVARYPGRIAAAHYRFDANRSLEAMGEMIIIARETGIRFQISHIGSCTAFGQMEAGLQMLSAAYDAGVDIMADVYPYDAFCTYVGSAIFDEGCFKNWGVSYEALQVAQGKYRGQRCTQEIFEYIRQKEPDDLVIAFVMDETEVIQALQHPLVMIASDGLMTAGQGHPRSAGTFPRVIGKYVREEKKLDLIEAIKKMTYMPAQRLNLKTKGRLKEGYDADITIFDYEYIIDRATFKEPALTPEGISNVIINGVEVVLAGKLTRNNSGRVIRYQHI